MCTAERWRRAVFKDEKRARVTCSLRTEKTNPTSDIHRTRSPFLALRSPPTPSRFNNASVSRKLSPVRENFTFQRRSCRVKQPFSFSFFSFHSVSFSTQKKIFEQRYRSRNNRLEHGSFLQFPPFVLMMASRILAKRHGAARRATVLDNIRGSRLL